MKPTQTWSRGGGLLDEEWLEPDTCPKRANMFRENEEPCTRAENVGLNKENYYIVHFGFTISIQSETTQSMWQKKSNGTSSG